MADVAGSAPRPYFEFRPILRALRISTDIGKLILATAGLVLLYAGWFAVDAAFGVTGFPETESWPRAVGGSSLDALNTSPIDAGNQITEPFRTVVTPFAALFTRGLGPAGWFRSALKAIWAAVVWGILGGAMARMAVVQAAVDRKVGLITALRFAVGKAVSFIGAPLTPMLAVAVLAAGCALFGLMTRIPGGVGGIFAMLLGFVPLLFGVLMALVLLGLAIGWPLMHATIAAENEDAPDALSRAYSYVNQRLVRYLLHAVITLAIGAFGLVLVVGFAQVVLALAEWGVAIGGPKVQDFDDWAKTGRLFWGRVVALVVLAWVYSYFWSAASILYLIVRRDVDGTAWHDIYLPEHDADTFAGEPPAEIVTQDPSPIAGP